MTGDQAMADRQRIQRLKTSRRREVDNLRIEIERLSDCERLRDRDKRDGEGLNGKLAEARSREGENSSLQDRERAES